MFFLKEERKRKWEWNGSSKVGLLRVLGPAHVWALGVGIVLVGEYMGWNFAVGKGGAYAALVACWFAGILYTCVAMIDSEVTSTVAAAGPWLGGFAKDRLGGFDPAFWLFAGDRLRRHRHG